MTSVLSPPGKYRIRKDWSTNSIPQSVEEEVMASPTIIINNGMPYNGATLMPHTDAMPPIKPPRRSSLAISMLTGKSISSAAISDKTNKRRSSIAVAFLGKKDSNNSKSNAYLSPNTIEGQGRHHSRSESDLENDPNMVLTVPDGYDKEKKRRRSSWQAKLDRRRRKQGVLQTGSINDDTLDVDMIPTPDGMYQRQKRHSWWTIFVPDNLKSR
uniref:CSON009379 protein n=1 Tax=Culicoides sonorensis TaxID=179676 RepID=A0A336N2I5_CULSO